MDFRTEKQFSVPICRRGTVTSFRSARVALSCSFSTSLTDTVKLVRSTEADINLINIFEQVFSLFLSQVVLKPASHLRRQGELAVAESPGATQPADQVTGSTGDTGFAGIPRRTNPLAQVFAFLDQQKAQIRRLW